MKRKTIVYLTFLIACTTLATSSHALANQNQTTQIINKIIEAYGGDTLKKAKSLRIIDHNKGPWPGESENPGLPEIWRINEELTVDFENKRKSLISYRVPRTTIDLEKWIFDGKDGYIYDILHQKYSTVDWLNYDNLGGPVMRSSDLMHAKKLYNDVKEALFLGTEFYRGKPHQKIEVNYNTGGTFTYYIDEDSGFIRKIVRAHPKNTLIYVFSNHQRKHNLTFAKDMNFFVNGEFRLSSVLKDIEIDPDLKQAFAKPKNFSSWGQRIDNKNLEAKKIGIDVFQAGKGRAKTVFIEQPNHYIAIGGANALKENFEALKELTQKQKPLGYFIVSHHHRGNLIGLENAIKLGAKLVTAKAHQKKVLDSLSKSNVSKRVVAVSNRVPFKLGNLTLHDIPTAHSKHYLLVHSSLNEMIIAEEHYEVQLKEGKPRIYKDMVIFANAVKQLNIDVKTLVDINSWRSIDINDFNKWIDDFEQPTCPIDYRVCADG